MGINLVLLGKWDNIRVSNGYCRILINIADRDVFFASAKKINHAQIKHYRHLVPLFDFNV